MSNETVTIPAEVWKRTLVKVDELQAENERLCKNLDYVLDDWGCFKVGFSGGNGIDSVFKAWLYAKGVQS
jgi:hypothetical protein